MFEALGVRHIDVIAKKGFSIKHLDHSKQINTFLINGTRTKHGYHAFLIRQDIVATTTLERCGTPPGLGM